MKERTSNTMELNVNIRRHLCHFQRVYVCACGNVRFACFVREKKNTFSLNESCEREAIQGLPRVNAIFIYKIVWKWNFVLYNVYFVSVVKDIVRLQNI